MAAQRLKVTDVESSKLLASTIADSSDEEAAEKLAGLANDARGDVGLRNRLAGDFGQVGVAEPFSPDGPPDSVLEVARRIISKEGKYVTESGNLRKQAYRVVANSCADQANKRCCDYLIDRGLITTFKTLILGRQDNLALLLPACYNVCVNSSLKKLDLGSSQISTSANNDHEPQQKHQLTLGEYVLGQPLEGSTSSTMELLLALIEPHSSSHYENVPPFSIDLILLASRPALFDPVLILPGLPADYSSKASSLLSAFTISLDESLLTSFTVEDALTLVEAVLNLLSQPLFQDCAVQHGPFLLFIYSLANMSFGRDDCEDYHEYPTSDVESARDSLLKIIYSLSSLPNYPEHHPPNGALVRQASTDLIQLQSELPLMPPQYTHHGFYAMSCILIANSLADLSRVDSYLSFIHQDQDSLVAILLKILHNFYDTTFLRPVLNLVIRLSYTSAGQQLLMSKQPVILDTLHRLVSTTFENHSISIRCDAIALTRLLIKSSPTHMHLLLQHPSLCSAILDNFANPAPQIKTEISKLGIEILRCYIREPDQNLHDITLQRLIGPVVHQIICDGPPTAQAEGVFGLALLAKIVADRPQYVVQTLFVVLNEDRRSIRATLERIMMAEDMDKDKENVKALATQLLLLRGKVNGVDEVFQMLEEVKDGSLS